MSITSRCMKLSILLLRNHNFLIVLVGYAESGSFVTVPQQIIEIRTWSWIFLHISLHPIRKLLLGSETKPRPLRRRWLKTRVDTVRWLPIILGIIPKSPGLGNTKDQYRFLQGARTLLRENTFIEEIIRSPKLE